MHAEIVAVGTELTTGARLDTNSQWLSLELAALGIPVHYHTTVADDLPAMVGVLRAAVHRSDVVLITGGLGPTLDDLTRQALAELTQTQLVLHEPSLEFIRGFFARHRREMPERNRSQALFPEQSEPLFNPRGTAPGIWLEVSRKTSASPCLVAAMPGVPSEMQRMFHKEVAPRLPQGARVIRRARINTFGVGESKAEELLGDLTARGRDPEIGITVHEATITLRISAEGTTADECERKIAAARAAIHECMGQLVFGEEDDELEHVVGRLLAERGCTLATVESGSGGLLAQRLYAVDGSASFYRGGVVAAHSAARGLLQPFAEEFVSEPAESTAQSVAALAEGCRARFEADYALAIGDWPPYDPEAQQASAPGAFVALAGGNVHKTAPFTLLGDPAINRVRAAKIALNLLRLHLLGQR